MLRTLVTATIVAGLSAPAMAQGSWYVLKSAAAAPTQAAPEDQPCFVADRQASNGGEQQVAGPFPSHEAGEEAMLELAACQQGIEFQEGD